MESSVAVPRRTTSISRSRTRRAGNGDGDGVDREAIARGDGRGPGEDGLLMGTDTVDFSIPGDGLDAQQALFDEYLSLSPITFPNGNGAVAGGEGAALTLSMASPPQTTTTGFSAPTTPEKYDEDSFLDFYAETPVDSGGPFVLSSPQMPFPNSSHPPVPTTPAPPPPPQQQPQQHHPQTQPFNMPLPFQLPYNNSGQSLRRTNTASSISSLALARSRTVLGENQASVIIPTRQSSRGPGGLAQRFNALTSSASTGQLVPTRGIAVSEKGRSQTPTPGTYKPILEGAAASASPSVSLSSTHHVQIEQLLESGLRALALLNISDALSLWKQAVGGSQEGSLTTVRALSNLCVGYRRHGNFAKSRDASRDAWRILERGIWVEVLDSLPGGHAIGGGAPSGGKSLSSNSTTISSLTSGSSASKESAIGSGTGVNTDAVVNLLVGVGLIGFDEGFALGTDDMPGGGSLNGRKGTLGGKSIGRKASYTPSHASTFHASSASSQPPLPSHQTPPPFHMPSPLPSLQEDDRDLDEALLSDPLIKSMRAVIKVVKRWLERRRFEYLASTNIGKTHQPPTLFNNHRMPSKMTRMGSLDSFSTVASSESAPSASPFPQIPVDPVLLVTVLDLCTNTGNLYYTMQSYQVATFFHESCLDLAQDILTTIPLPAKEPPASPTSSIKLSYLHSNTLMAKSRSMSHLSLCLGACGDVHRAVRFGQMSFASIASVAGPQPADRAGVHAKQWRFTRAAIAGNLGRAQFAVGRYVEGMRGCVAAVKAFSREDKYGTVEGGSCAGEQTAAADRVPTVSAADRAGLLRALVNVAACWVEAGRLGCMVNVWVGDAKTSGLRRAGTGEDVEPDFAFYDQHFAIPRPNMTSPSVSIPQRKHSALRKESMGTDIDLGILREIKVAFARKNSPLWFADVLTGIRLLERVISEAGKYKYLECVGIARFNIASACIIIQQPYLAAKLLVEAPYSWKEIMKQVANTPTPAQLIPSTGSTDDIMDPSIMLSSHIQGPAALFNFAQLLFVVASNGIAIKSAFPPPTEADTVAVDFISKLVLSTTRSAGPMDAKDGHEVDALNRPRGVGEASAGMLDLANGIVDPDLLVVSLKLCLKLFDGSSYGPYSTPLAKIKSVESSLASPTKKSIFSDDVFDSSSPTNTISSNSSRQPFLVLPEKPKPSGSPTTYTTRICLALARTLITVYAPFLDRTGDSQRRVLRVREEARRWCGSEATAGLENAAIASGGSSAFRDKADVFLDKKGAGGSSSGVGLAAKQNTEIKRRSMVVKGSALEGLLVSALSGTGEVHGNLAMEVGSVALEVEMLASKQWALDKLLQEKLETSPGGFTTTQDGIVHRLVRLASRRVRDGVIGPMRWEEAVLEEAVTPFILN